MAIEQPQTVRIHKHKRTFVYTVAGRARGSGQTVAMQQKPTTFQIAMSANFAYSNRIFFVPLKNNQSMWIAWKQRAPEEEGDRDAGRK